MNVQFGVKLCTNDVCMFTEKNVQNNFCWQNLLFVHRVHCIAPYTHSNGFFENARKQKNVQNRTKNVLNVSSVHLPLALMLLRSAQADCGLN